ncbi:S41 family peptidase [Brevundimonas sp.]|uniref:S41 family peptidase n=1 Tax=Brevundimonas sp. TaxID=1871086 RepID=UPI0035B4DE9D
MSFRRWTRRAASGLAAWAAIAAAAPAAAQTDWTALYERLWQAVDTNFYDPHFLGTDWDAVGQTYRVRAAGVTSEAEFLDLANAMLGEIGSSHLYVSAPAATSGRIGRTSIAARFETMDGRRVVAEVAPLSDAWRQGLRPGHILTSEPSALLGDIGTLAEFEVTTCEDRPLSLQARREQAFWPPEGPGFRWSRIRTGADARLGYMRIDRFDDGAAELADQAMAAFDDVGAIVIDLRGNSGGNVSSLRLASYFAHEPVPGVILMSRPYLEALGRPATPADLAAAPRIDRGYTGGAVFEAISRHGGAAFWTEAVDTPFTGPVVVLIGPETGSAAEGFAWFMREHTDARLIGEETAGALLSGDRFDLGDGWSVTIPVHGLWGADGTDYGDRAVPPHTPVVTGRDDLCAGRDPVLEEAFRQAESDISTGAVAR